MEKIIRYTSIEALKASSNALPAQQPSAEYEAELIEAFSILRKHSAPTAPPKPHKPQRQTDRGK